MRCCRITSQARLASLQAALPAPACAGLRFAIPGDPITAASISRNSVLLARIAGPPPGRKATTSHPVLASTSSSLPDQLPGPSRIAQLRLCSLFFHSSSTATRELASRDCLLRGFCSLPLFPFGGHISRVRPSQRTVLTARLAAGEAPDLGGSWGRDDSWPALVQELCVVGVAQNYHDSYGCPGASVPADWFRNLDDHFVAAQLPRGP